MRGYRVVLKPVSFTAKLWAALANQATRDVYVFAINPEIAKGIANQMYSNWIAVECWQQIDLLEMK